MPIPESADAAFALGDALFAEAIRLARARAARPVLVGLAGAQGSGKSTMAARLARRLAGEGLAVAVCSLDDFYLTRAERQALAAAVHPLLAVRGVPGTHDVALMRRTIDALLAAGTDSVTALPAFDKASDDRRPPADWPRHAGPGDVVLLEGWCVGARAQDEAALARPINALERDEDGGGRWRAHANACLRRDYAPLFDRLDLRLMLRAPSFDCVHAWRAEQEAGLERGAPGARPPMDSAALARFIAHYERITRWLLEDEPADLIADLGRDRAPVGWRRAAGAPAA